MKDAYNKFRARIDKLLSDFNIQDIYTFKNTLDAIYNNPKTTLRQLTSRGNRKVGFDTLIFNMGPAYNCPSEKLGLCKVADKCYAKKAENQYWITAGHKRHEQEKYWLSVTAEQFVTELVDIVKKAHIPIKYLRFNESGDFHTQDCVDKLVKIAKLSAISLPKLVIYTYTARSDLDFTEALKQPNLVINGSGFMLDNNFSIAKTNKELKSGDRICGGDCSICSYCKVKQHNIIKVKIH